MKLDRLSLWSLVVCLCAVAGCSAEGPREICERWVLASCETFVGCCTTGDDFEGLQCQSDMWSVCLTRLRADAVRGGAEFDPAAAQDCLAPITACNLEASIPENQNIACQNATTGHNAPGEACSRASECQRPAEGYASCYTGVAHDSPGVCANVVLSADGKCGYGAVTHVHTVCPKGQFCDVSSLVSGGGVEEGVHTFLADCRPLSVAGQACLTPSADPTAKACGEGLQCGLDPAGIMGSVCLQRKARGEACKPGECADRLPRVPAVSTPPS